MAFAVLEEKMSRVSPQFLDELSAFIDFLLYRQGDVAAATCAHRKTPGARSGFGALRDKMNGVGSVPSKEGLGTPLNPKRLTRQPSKLFR